MLNQIGGGNCSLCGSPGTNKSTCPLNRSAVKPNPVKHPLARNAVARPLVPAGAVARPAQPIARPLVPAGAQPDARLAQLNDIGNVLETRIREYTTRQMAERQAKRPVMAVPLPVQHAYYDKMLPGWQDTEVRDIVMYDDRHIGEYINEDPDNIVIVVRGFKRPGRPVPPPVIFASKRSYVDNTLSMHECLTSDSMRHFTDKRYFKLASVGSPIGGATLYYPFKLLVSDSNYQIFFLDETRRRTRTLASHAVRMLSGNRLSDAHCQAGTDLAYLELNIPENIEREIRGYAQALLRADLRVAPATS